MACSCIGQSLPSSAQPIILVTFVETLVTWRPSKSVSDPDLEIRRGSSSSRPLDRGGGPPTIFFRSFGPQFGLKIRRRSRLPRAPPLEPPLPMLIHVLPICKQSEYQHWGRREGVNTVSGKFHKTLENGVTWKILSFRFVFQRNLTTVAGLGHKQM